MGHADCEGTKLEIEMYEYHQSIFSMIKHTIVPPDVEMSHPRIPLDTVDYLYRYTRAVVENSSRRKHGTKLESRRSLSRTEQRKRRMVAKEEIDD